MAAHDLALNSNLVRLHFIGNTYQYSDDGFKFQSGATAFEFAILCRNNGYNFKFQSGATAFLSCTYWPFEYQSFKFQSGATALRSAFSMPYIIKL